MRLASPRSKAAGSPSKASTTAAVPSALQSSSTRGACASSHPAAPLGLLLLPSSPCRPMGSGNSKGGNKAVKAEKLAVMPELKGELSEAQIEELVLQLNKIEAVKFGEFKLKSGLISPVYVDLRVIVSHPAVLASVSRMMMQCCTNGGAEYDIMCGVPYTALPIAACMSLGYGVPMVMRRKEVKDYGTKKAVEGAYERGQRCLVVEDLVTSGASVLETLGPLQEAGLRVTDVVVLIDREQGGAAHLAANGLKLHAAFKLSFMLDVLERRQLVDADTARKVRDFVAANQTAAPPVPSAAAPAASSSTYKRLPYAERAALAVNPVARACFEVMERKRTNLAVAADVATVAEMLALADAVGPHIAVFKTHVDIFDAWDDATAARLAGLAKQHDFLIFEDRKFADIGNTVVSQYGGGIYKIADWSHITNAHLVPGPGIISGLKQVGAPKGRGLLLLAEMSSKGTLAAGAYTEAVAAAAAAEPEFVMGFISTNPGGWKGGPGHAGLIHMTPGVQLAAGGDALGQQYNTPGAVIGERCSDVIIVGRGVIAAPDPAAAAAEYKAAGWAAYEAALAKRESV